MARAIIEIFDHSLQKVDIWLKDLMREIGSDDPREAYVALRSVLHALRDRLPPDEALHLGAQMPTLIRGFYLEGWIPSRTPERIRSRNEFLEFVLIHAREAPWFLDVEYVVRGVFNVLCQHITLGQILDVVRILPIELRELWPTRIQEMTNRVDEINRRGRETGHSRVQRPSDELGPINKVLRREEIFVPTGRIREEGKKSTQNYSKREASRDDRRETRQEGRQDAREAGRESTNYQTNDQKLVEEIYELLTRNSDIDASDIDVEVHRGVVHLHGIVDDRRSRRRVEEILEDLRGVQDIQNTLRVRSQRDYEGGDHDRIRERRTRIIEEREPSRGDLRNSRDHYRDLPPRF